MLEHAMLRDLFEDLLDKSRQAREGYEALAARPEAAELREKLLQIERDKSRHVYLVERLLEVVQ
ncbi:MAG: hypothetical protein ACLFV7_04775 [Phycisphaerae bacterium]